MFPCDGYLQLAKELVVVVNNESCMRSAVSRAYYASLHKSMKFAEGRGHTFLCKGKPEIHKEVIDYFCFNSSTVLHFLGVDLGRLKKNRTECNYDENIRNVKKTAENAIINAEEIFNKIMISSTH